MISKRRSAAETSFLGFKKILSCFNGQKFFVLGDERNYASLDPCLVGEGLIGRGGPYNSFVSC